MELMEAWILGWGMMPQIEGGAADEQLIHRLGILT